MRMVMRSSVLFVLTAWAAWIVPVVCLADGSTTSERTVKTTRVVHNKDGSVTTTVTVVRTGTDGRSSTSTSSTTTFPGDPIPVDGQGGDPPQPPDAPETTASPPPPPPPPVPPAKGKVQLQQGDAPWVREALLAHNSERQKVGAPPLAWNPALAKLATDWSSYLCGGGKQARPLQHRPPRPGGPGENLWQGAATSGQAFPITEAVQSWASERRWFDPQTGRCRGGECGHYTQVIWRTTTHVGCGVATCPSRGFSATVWTCNYAPAGNMMGQRP